jgi:hypothetical protein
MAANACCSYRRFNSLPSSALTILGVMASEVPRKLWESKTKTGGLLPIARAM